MNFVDKFFLRRYWLPRSKKVMVRCSGKRYREGRIVECFKDIRLSDGIRLDYSNARQIHIVHFCSLDCLRSFLKWISNLG